MGNDRSDFAHPGDSGALVVDGEGIAIGMVVAGGTELGNPFPFTFVTPMAEMLEDIDRAVDGGSSSATLL